MGASVMGRRWNRHSTLVRETRIDGVLSLWPWLFWVLTKLARGSLVQAGVRGARGARLLLEPVRAGRHALAWPAETRLDGTGRRIFPPGASPGRDGPTRCPPGLTPQLGAACFRRRLLSIARSRPMWTVDGDGARHV